MKDRIKKVMESQHMTQQLFAEFLGIAPATLSSIFTGRTRPTLQVVEAIKNKLPTISTDWLMFGSGEMTVSQSASDSTTPPAESRNMSSEPLLTFDDTSRASQYGNVSQPAQQYPAKESVVVVKNIDKPQRRITEIRLFYDDQTWETFVPKK